MSEATVQIRRVREVPGYQFNRGDGTPIAIGETMEVPADVVASQGCVESWGFERLAEGAGPAEPARLKAKRPPAGIDG